MLLQVKLKEFYILFLSEASTNVKNVQTLVTEPGLNSLLKKEKTTKK